jgi:hypothetical protein
MGSSLFFRAVNNSILGEPGLLFPEFQLTLAHRHESNHPMQGLLRKLGYEPSGIINNLDEDDPELIYLKRLTQEQPTTGCT